MLWCRLLSLRLLRWALARVRTGWAKTDEHEGLSFLKNTNYPNNTNIDTAESLESFKEHE